LNATTLKIVAIAAEYDAGVAFPVQWHGTFRNHPWRTQAASSQQASTDQRTDGARVASTDTARASALTPAGRPEVDQDFRGSRGCRDHLTD
jgi:hypothetical protein